MSNSETTTIPILVAGAVGKMGAHVIKAVADSDQFSLIAAIDNAPEHQGFDVGSVLGIGPLDILITSDFEGALCSASQMLREQNSIKKTPVLIDFTHPKVVYDHTRSSIAYGIHPVIGTTGLNDKQLHELNEFSIKSSVSVAVIPNFSVGMVLLQQAAAAAAGFYKHAELIESHHNKKVDSPSGTCIKTAQLIEEVSSLFNEDTADFDSDDNSRGKKRESGLRLHSIRLPGLVAHQEVVFGSEGETYKLEHNTIDRSAYMPGVLLVASKIGRRNGLIYGLEKFL